MPLGLWPSFCFALTPFLCSVCRAIQAKPAIYRARAILPQGVGFNLKRRQGARGRWLSRQRLSLTLTGPTAVASVLGTLKYGLGMIPEVRLFGKEDKLICQIPAFFFISNQSPISLGNDTGCQFRGSSLKSSSARQTLLRVLDMKDSKLKDWRREGRKPEPIPQISTQGE